ncbi:efflux RND transporter periplasmic adaptor subunit [Clostridium sp. JS66]|uniref:efflux RND transporter periplasmic adaptor subunit n=1 Tax=Clostridium sp. JS66 TaxID=3064705 RepID=UPI00298DF035|nr:efflux RND transporter periplasmic adaptor subunit [Clostridium sp. JS66]WPC40581.1 efflux RND transporter periplasmic adaptor subunit [Clostridium sp. JS66]
MSNKILNIIKNKLSNTATRKNLSIIFLSTITILAIVALTAYFTVFSKNTEKETTTKSYPVKTMEIKSGSFPMTLQYQGLTGGSEVRKLSFKSSAKIMKIYVSKGQHVKKGEKLAELDKTDLNFAAQASKSKVDEASAQYDKAVNGTQQEDINRAEIAVKNAQNGCNYYKDLYNKYLKLYQSSAISSQQLNDSKLQLDNAQNSLNSAEQSLQQLQKGSRPEDKQATLGQLNEAKADYESKENILNDASMTADMDGYVVDVLGKEGEMQQAGNPVILFRSEKQVITVGLSEDDVKKVKIGTKAQVNIGDDKAQGEIINIVQLADSKSGTYSAEINLSTPIDTSKYYVGETSTVYIDMGQTNSISIPINSVLNDGEDYVYVVENGHAVKKNITLGDTNEDKVSVEGLKNGDKLVIEGMKNLKSGYKVTIK